MHRRRIGNSTKPAAHNVTNAKADEVLATLPTVAAAAATQAVTVPNVVTVKPIETGMIINRCASDVYGLSIRFSDSTQSAYLENAPILSFSVHYESDTSVRLFVYTPHQSVLLILTNFEGAEFPVLLPGGDNYNQTIQLPFTIQKIADAPAYKIPRIVHQTYVSRHTTVPNILACQTWWMQNLAYEYRFYDDDTCARLMMDMAITLKPLLENIDILQAYNMLYAGAYKSDLFRLALLYIHGGVWADVSSVCEQAIDSYIHPTDNLVVCVDTPCQVRYANIHQAYLYAAPQSPILLHILKYTASTVLGRRFELPGMVFQSISVTGPTAFAEGLNMHMGRQSKQYFDKMRDDNHLFLDNDTSSDVFRFQPFTTDRGVRYLDHVNRHIWSTPSKMVITTKYPGFEHYRTTPHYSILGSQGYLYKHKIANVQLKKQKGVWNLYQVWLQGNLVSTSMAQAIDTWKQDYDWCNYKFCTEADAKDVLMAIGPEYYKAYTMLKPHAFKCDLLRAALLYGTGGLYVDVDMVSLTSLRSLTQENDVVLLSSGFEQVDNGLMFFAKPKHPLLLHYLNRMVANIVCRVGVTSDLALTGPRLWSQCIHEYYGMVDFVADRYTLRNDRLVLLRHEAITPNHDMTMVTDSFRNKAVTTIAPGTTIVTCENVKYACTKYPNYNQERIIMGGTNFAEEFQQRKIFTD
jgi:mannosyltransferase OCH1-like enzyme